MTGCGPGSLSEATEVLERRCRDSLRKMPESLLLLVELSRESIESEAARTKGCSENWEDTDEGRLMRDASIQARLLYVCTYKTRTMMPSVCWRKGNLLLYRPPEH